MNEVMKDLAVELLVVFRMGTALNRDYHTIPKPERDEMKRKYMERKKALERKANDIAHAFDAYDEVIDSFSVAEGERLPKCWR